MKRKNLILLGLLFSLCISIASPSFALGYFGEFQSIPTNGATDIESFVINGETYLAVANGSNDVTPNIDSFIYKFNGVAFDKIQTIPTNSAQDWESFVINGETYLVVANHNLGATPEAESVIFKWNGTIFVEIQRIQTVGAFHWESFAINGETFIFASNMYGSYGSYFGNSVVYRWNVASQIFVEYQRMPTIGAMKSCAFTVGSDTYLVAANVSDGVTTSRLNSIVYKWTGNFFVEFQAIPTDGGAVPTIFVAGGRTYLAIGNLYNAPNNLVLYMFDGSAFVQVQSLNTGAIYGLDSLVVEGQAYLAVAVYSSSDYVTTSVDSLIYKWNGTSLVLVQEIPTNGARDIHGFFMGNRQYLAVSNYYSGQTRNTNSKIYQWIPANIVPTVDAGPNMEIPSNTVSATTLHGTAIDPDTADILSYKWKEGNTILFDSLVGANGDCPLDLAALGLSIGTHALTLEVSDGKATSTDEMILTIGNSAPNVVPSGGGSYGLGDSVLLSGQVSDFDGDFLSYTWTLGSTLFSGSIQTVAGGAVATLPENILTNLALGSHAVSLEVTDGINTVVKTVNVTIIDGIKPTLAPTVNLLILWPPNHNMVNIIIDTNASDNSGQPVILTASVTSNEPILSNESGDLSPDWTTPVINQGTGIVTFQLRAERLGKGSGRVYSILLTATDQSGNMSNATIQIAVPHDKGK